MNDSKKNRELTILGVRIHAVSILILGLLLLNIFAALHAAQAATVTWDGGGGDQLWSTPANWSGDTLPQSTDTILIEGNVGQVFLNIDFTHEGELRIDKAGAISGPTLVINNGVTLTLNDSSPQDQVIGLYGSTLINDGTIEGIYPVTNISAFEGGAFINNGTVNGVASGRVNVGSSSQGIVTNNGTMDLVVILLLNGNFDNNGFVNDAKINTQSSSTINNNANSTINIIPSASGFLNIFSSGTVFNNHGTVTNPATITNNGTFNNFGTFDNTNGFFDNQFGTFNSECDSVLLGSISGNQPIEAVCDTTPPDITVPADITAEATSESGASVSYTASANDDTDGAITPTCAPLSGVSFPLGETQVTCTATDAAGNTASASFIVNVVDTTLPVLTVPPDLTEEANAVSSTVDIGMATATDIFLDTVTNDAPATFPLGTTTVTWTATDTSGNVASATQHVTVVDTTPPLLTVPPNVTAEANAVLSTVNIGMATAMDIFAVTVTNDAAAGFSLGTTTVTWVATDANGNSATGTQVVTVEDTTPPVLTAPPDVTAEANAALSTVAIGMATATDIFLDTVTNDAPATFPLGTTTVTWTATDTSGNTTKATQHVTVVDTTPPVLTVPADMTVTATGALTAVAIGTATATDIFGPVTIANNAPGGGFPVGTTEVTWTATDANGNTASATQRIHVVYQFGGFLSPVVQGGVYKAGRTLPVKIRAFLADGTLAPELTATLNVQLLNGGVPSGDPLDVGSTSAADSGTTFRLSDDLYIFNLNTESLSAGTYRLFADLHDGSLPRFIDIALK